MLAFTCWTSKLDTPLDHIAFSFHQRDTLSSSRSSLNLSLPPLFYYPDNNEWCQRKTRRNSGGKTMHPKDDWNDAFSYSDIKSLKLLLGFTGGKYVQVYIKGNLTTVAQAARPWSSTGDTWFRSKWSMAGTAGCSVFWFHHEMPASQICPGRKEIGASNPSPWSSVFLFQKGSPSLPGPSYVPHRTEPGHRVSGCKAPRAADVALISSQGRGKQRGR